MLGHLPKRPYQHCAILAHMIDPNLDAIVSNLRENATDFKSLALGRIVQAIDFYDTREELRACLEKEVEALRIEAEYLEKYLTYYNSTVAKCRHAEADTIETFLQEMTLL